MTLAGYRLYHLSSFQDVKVLFAQKLFIEVLFKISLVLFVGLFIALYVGLFVGLFVDLFIGVFWFVCSLTRRRRRCQRARWMRERQRKKAVIVLQSFVAVVG